MASFYNQGSYYEWTDDERSKYTLGNVYTDIPTSAFQGLITQVIPAYTKIYKVEMSVYWKTGVGVTNGDGYLYIGDTQIGGKWQTSNKYITSSVPGSVHGYFQSGTANAGLPSSTIRFRSEASWGRTFYFTVKIKWYPTYKITVNGGTGGGEYNMGSNATITATPPAGYTFSKWSDGNPQNPRTIEKISSNQTYTAQFVPQQTTIETSYAIGVDGGSTEINDFRNYISTRVELTGAGNYNYGDTVTVNQKKTLPKKIKFTEWAFSNTPSSAQAFLTSYENPTTFTIDNRFLQPSYPDSVMTKIWAVYCGEVSKCNITTEIFPSTDAGSIEFHYSGFHPENDWDPISSKQLAPGATLTFRPKETNVLYQFVSWSDGSTEKERTIFLEDDCYLGAIFKRKKVNITFEIDPIGTGTIKATLEDGTDVSSQTQFEIGTKLILTAIPNEGYSFKSWENVSMTDPSRVFEVTRAQYITAYFELAKINKIYIGTSQPKDIYVGNQKVKEVYIGTTKIYG